MMNRIAEADGMRRGGAERRDVLTDFVRKIHVNRSVGQMAALLVAAFAIFTILRPAVFLGSYNLQVIALAAPEIGILAIAMMVTMLSGGIDLSVVSIANASAITISMTYTAVSSRAGVELANSLALPLVLLGLVVGVAAGRDQRTAHREGRDHPHPRHPGARCNCSTGSSSSSPAAGRFTGPRRG
jgi:simple sugar transport system permease protein